jgi:hypothetical protein
MRRAAITTTKLGKPNTGVMVRKKKKKQNNKENKKPGKNRGRRR